MGIWIAGEAILWQLGLFTLPAAVYDDWLRENDRLAVSATGTVEKLESTAYGIRLVLKDNSVSCRGIVGVPRRLLVSLKETKEWKIGNRVRVTGELSHFSLPGNPGEFDVRGYYRSQGIDYMVEGETAEMVEASVDLPREFLAGLRRTGRENISRVTGEEDAGVFAAVFLGDTSLLPEETKKLYQEGGIAHILAVSGLHVSLLGMGLFRLLLRLPLPKRVPEIMSAVLMTGYVAVAGASVSSRRALILFLALLLSRILGRSYDTLSALGLAGLFILAAQPMQLFQAGFQLSFGTVAGLGLLGPELERWGRPKRPWEKALLSSLCATAGTMPVAAWHYFQVAVSGIWLNLLVLPLSSLLLLSAVLTAVSSGMFPVLGAFFAGTGHYILVLYRFLCECGGKSVRTGRPDGWQIAAFYGLLLLFVIAGRILRKREAARRERGFCSKDEVAPGKKAARWAVLGAVFLMLLCVLLPFPDRGLTVVNLDVGQGDSTFLRTPDGTCWLIDGGSSSVSEVGKKRILPFLKSEGVGELRGVILSHSDEDHINGVEDLLESGEVRIGSLILPKASRREGAWDHILNLASAAGVPVLEMEAGQRFSEGAVSFACLHPASQFTGTDANSLSLVLEIQAEGFRELFPGDLGQAEEFLFQEAWEPLTVLKVGHHGSRGSSGEEFLRAVRPVYAVISCGKKNSYGHPHQETLDRLKDAGSHVYRTDENGAVRFFLRSGKLTVTPFRQEKKTG